MGLSPYVRPFFVEKQTIDASESRQVNYYSYMDHATTEPRYVYSRLAADPDLGEIVAMFVEEMPGRMAALIGQLNAADWDGLQRTAHQLKGAAGSYGFDGISPSAGRVEAAVRNGEPEEHIRAMVDELVDLCNRARGGLPQ